MSQERTLRVVVPTSWRQRVQELQASAAACLRRLDAAEFGDEDVEFQRYEKIQSELDRIAYQAFAASGSAPSHETRQCLEVTWPFGGGSTKVTATHHGVLPPRQAWSPQAARGRGTDVVKHRFSMQLQAWIDAAVDPGKPEPSPAYPSQVKNEALSEALRHYADADRSPCAVTARLQYTDGSEPEGIQLASLRFLSSPKLPGYRAFSVTLMSIRHLGMDVNVDGAWLRNREISVGRLMAQTDAIAYRESRRQLEKLTRHEPLILHMYQTGLPPSNIGFYRAVIDHHLERAGHAVVVVPWYFRGENRNDPGTIWQVYT